jgi:hypothetical protein
MGSNEHQGLQAIRHLRFWFWFFLLTYVPVIWIVKRVTRSDLAVAPFILVWVVGFVRYTARTAFSHCPRCGGYFHSTTGTPSFWNLLARECMQCGLPLDADEAPEEKMTT